MKKVFIVHGFGSGPSGGWRPWLLGELEKMDIHAFALTMPNPNEPVCHEWVDELTRQLESSQDDEIYLVGHSLGATTILRYLESVEAIKIQGAVLVSGPSEKNNNRMIDFFLDKAFDFDAIKSKAKNFCIIHGNDDQNVPLSNAEFLADKLKADLVVIPGGGHLNGSSGWLSLPQALEALQKMFN